MDGTKWAMSSDINRVLYAYLEARKEVNAEIGRITRQIDALIVERNALYDQPQIPTIAAEHGISADRLAEALRNHEESEVG